MYKLVSLSTLVLLLGAGGAAGQHASRQCAPIYDVTVAGLRNYADGDISLMTPATVTRHVDGDTFWVHFACPPPGPQATEKVRLMGIDTPELGQPGASRAQRYVQRRIGADPVYLAFDFRRRDRFDRLLAYVYLADGTLLNARLIECRLAQPYRGDSNHFSNHFERLAAQPPPADCPQAGPDPSPPAPDAVVIVAIVNKGSSEHVLLRNNSHETVDVSGWRLRDDDGTNLVIPQTDPLPPRETLALCSGRAGCVGDPRPRVTLTTENIWGNKGDTAFLHDAGGTEVSSLCYGNAC